MKKEKEMEYMINSVIALRNANNTLIQYIKIKI